MKIMKKYGFVFLMIFLSILTGLKYREIHYFKVNSENFSFAVSGDEDQILKLKSNIQNMTYQEVEYEKIENGKYLFRFRCPPDKVNFIISKLEKARD